MTLRRADGPLPKSGSLVAEWYLAWIRSLERCAFCWSPPAHAHHHPPRGRGVRRDDLTAPVCATCHRRCHGDTLIVEERKLGPIGEEQQADAVARTWRRFWETADALQLAQMARAVLLMRELRGEPEVLF